MFRIAEEQHLEFHPVTEFKVLDGNKIFKMIFNLLQYPLVIEEAATKRLPHKLPQFLLALATSLHTYYNDERVITENTQEVMEKLTVLKSVQIVLKDGLSLIGVGVKERM